MVPRAKKSPRANLPTPRRPKPPNPPLQPLKKPPASRNPTERSPRGLCARYRFGPAPQPLIAARRPRAIRHGPSQRAEFVLLYGARYSSLGATQHPPEADQLQGTTILQQRRPGDRQLDKCPRWQLVIRHKGHAVAAQIDGFATANRNDFILLQDPEPDPALHHKALLSPPFDGYLRFPCFHSFFAHHARVVQFCKHDSSIPILPAVREPQHTEQPFILSRIAFFTS